MGNHHSHDGVRRNSFGRSHHLTDTTDKTPTQLIPIDKLAKILAQKSLEEDSVQGITCRVFTNTVFPRYPDLSQRLFTYLHSSAGSNKHEWISTTAFKQQAEKFLGIIADDRQLEIYVKIYADGGENITQENFLELLMQAYRLAMDHYTDGPQTCNHLPKIQKAVIESAFHRKSVVSVNFLSHWIQQHTPRLIVGIHRYIVHVLSTAYREAGQSVSSGLELGTPVLEQSISFPENKENDMLPLSEVWLLASSLPPLYIRPSQHHSPASSNGLSSQAFIAKMLGSICPSHWNLLYNSDQHGLGANRFKHHVFDYRGPTLSFLRGDEGVLFCVASDTEWQETHQYWGKEDCAVIQILPLYNIVERGAKMLYFNSTIRGYPKGLRAGLDPRKPMIDVDDGFTVVNYRAIPYPLYSVQVWGCGTQQSRDVQLDMKKQQLTEVERRQKIKLTADDWVDHPDRYLLELAGRPCYSASQADSSKPHEL